MEKTKSCFKCGETKPLSAFYKHSQMADGRLNKCKACTKSDVTKYQTKNIDKVREYNRSRGNRNPPGYYKEYYRKNKEERLLAQKKWREENPVIYRARNAVGNALRDKTLIKTPCEVCGDTDNIHGHHDDYSKPLDVHWLCPKHHGEVHRKINEENR